MECSVLLFCGGVMCVVSFTAMTELASKCFVRAWGRLVLVCCFRYNVVAEVSGDLKKQFDWCFGGMFLTFTNTKTS